MDTEALNQAIAALIAKKAELNQLTYNDDRYDDVEEELHDMEDDFNEQFGSYLEEVLEEVHKTIAPESDVLLPTAYLPNRLDVNTKEAKTKSPERDGVWVEAEEFPGKEARLILMANPTRLVLAVGKNTEKEVWTA
jgi:hypothetical protein